MVETMARLGTLLPDCSLQAHAGNGAGAGAMAAAGRAVGRGDGLAALLRDKLRPAVAELGGTLVVLSTTGDSDARPRRRLGPARRRRRMAVMRALKERFDPAGVLNPGRFIY